MGKRRNEQKGIIGRKKKGRDIYHAACSSTCIITCPPFQGKGYDTSLHSLACFGGAGGQHACAIARSLGMRTVFIHRYSGILSAYGLALADVVHEAQEPCARVYEGKILGG